MLKDEKFPGGFTDTWCYHIVETVIFLHKHDLLHVMSQNIGTLAFQGRRKVCKGGAAESCYVVALPRKAQEKFSHFSFLAVKILTF